MFLRFQNRDTWIFAAGNETDDVTDYLNEIEEYWVGLSVVLIVA